MDAPYLAALDQRFSARPHVGAVTHFEGLDVRDAARRVRTVTDRLGLQLVGAVERAGGAPTFSATALVTAMDGMELWVIATERADVGIKLEARVFHAFEDSAAADEYLAGFVAQLTTAPRGGATPRERDTHADHT